MGPDFGGCLADPEETRLRNALSSTLETAIAGGEGPTVRARVFTHPKIFTYGHQVKGKGTNATRLEQLPGAVVSKWTAAVFVISQDGPFFPF